MAYERVKPTCSGVSCKDYGVSIFCNARGAVCDCPNDRILPSLPGTMVTWRFGLRVIFQFVMVTSLPWLG